MHDLIIIGAGPAGLTAALYAGRFKMDTLVIEKMIPGGQILLSPSIENYPGFPEGVSTFELVEKFKKQVDDLGVPFQNSQALGLKAENNIFTLDTSEGQLQARSVIVASGAKAKRLGIKGEDGFIGKGVSYCGTCDGPLFKGKEIAVIGGGDRAVEDALFLSTYASKVNLIHRRDQLRASRILVDKAAANPKIKFFLESTAEEITGSGKVESVRINNVKTAVVSEIKCSGVFIFVGIIPDTGFAKNLLDLDANGFIITGDSMHTSEKGIFAAGDCRKKSLYQVVSACSDGAAAADSAHKYLLNQ